MKNRDTVDILPEKIATTHDSRTGKTFYTNIYSLDNWSDLGFIAILLCIVVMGMLLPILSGILLLFYIIEHKPSTRLTMAVLSIVSAAYVLLDIKFNWFMTTVMKFFYDSKEFVFIRPFNFTMIIAGAFALIFGDAILNLIPDKNRGILFLLFVAFSAVIYSIIK